MARVAPVQSSDIRTNSQPNQQAKSGDPFAMLLDTVSAGRVNAAESRRKPDSTERPRHAAEQKAERAERPEPHPGERKVVQREVGLSAKKEDALNEEKPISGEEHGAEKETASQSDGANASSVTPQATDVPAVAVTIEVSAEAVVAMPSEGESESQIETPSILPADAAADADTGATASLETAPQPSIAAVPVEAAPVAPAQAPEISADGQDEALVAAASKTISAPASKSGDAVPVTAAAEAEQAAGGEEALQAVQTAKPETQGDARKPVSNLAEIRAEVMAERVDPSAQPKPANAEGQQQAREQASAKPLEVAAAQSNVENSTPRQTLTPPPVPVMPEPVRALAGSINPVNLRAADGQANNAVQANAGAIGIEIASRSRDGAKRFDIRLDPPELGRVEVRLEVDSNGKASTRLIVERPETLDLLQRDARNLERALQSAGLQTDEGGLEFSLQQQGQNELGDTGADQGYDRRGDYFASAIDDAEAAAPALDRYARSVLARGGVDIRI